MNKEKVKQFNSFLTQKEDLEIELQRVSDFLARDISNRDSELAIIKGKIFVKFAGTACMLPKVIFIEALHQRKTEIQQDLLQIESELSML